MPKKVHAFDLIALAIRLALCYYHSVIDVRYYVTLNTFDLFGI